MSNEFRDFLVVNARIATGHPRRPWAEAAEVVGDRVVWMGSAAEAMKRRRAGLVVVEVEGAALTADASALRLEVQRRVSNG
jgi:predicted amidohydrolase YtcJ